METENHEICLVPGGQLLQAVQGQTLLEVLIGAGIFLRSDCGGKGLCGKCLVKIHDSIQAEALSSDETEKKILGEKSLKSGFRLACRVKVLGAQSINIPENTLLSPEVSQKGPAILSARLSVSKASFPDNYGLAVDLGTTTIAVYLCDLVAGNVTASISVRNPQCLYGDDVMGRISAVTENRSYLARLQKMAVKAIEWGVASLCRSTRIEPEKIKKMVVVGNSTMIHLFAGEDPSSIGVFPYHPQFVEEKTFKADALGFRFNPWASVCTLPLVSGFLGSDILAATLATELDRYQEGTMLVDVGTNGEVMLLGKEGLFATSCATGPAFEGAAIRHGMQAVSGAIDSVRINRANGEIEYSVIQKDLAIPQKPFGICGSGVVSIVAELLRSGILLKDGRFNRETHSPNFHYDENGAPEFVVVPPEKTQTGRAVTLTQKDVRAIQLAKGALRTGIELLCQKTGRKRPKKLLVAGAFGNFIKQEDALTIGMFPELSEHDIEVVGNAAGAGAVLTLFDAGFQSKARKLRQSTRMLDLTIHPEFQKAFVASLPFPDPDKSELKNN